MSQVEPALAIVRPRAIRAGASEPLLLEDIVAELIEEGLCGVVPLVAPPGGGKTTALAHLAEVFTGRAELAFLDHPTVQQLHACRTDQLCVASTPPLPFDRTPVLRLTPWRLDELIEYLLVMHRGECGSVIERLGDSARRAWLPPLATIVLDRFSVSQTARDPIAEIRRHIDELLPDPQLQKPLRRACLISLRDRKTALLAPVVQQVQSQCGDQVRLLIRHDEVRTPLAAEAVVESLSHGSLDDLDQPFTPDLIDAVAERCRHLPRTLRALDGAMKAIRRKSAQPMAASVLYAIDSDWAPKAKRISSWNLAGGFFHGAKWPRANLIGANLTGADFTCAHLEGAFLTGATASQAEFNYASMGGANLTSARADRASFHGAWLPKVQAAYCNLSSADLTEADLSDSDLTAANLSCAELSSALFVRANLSKANLTGARLDGASFVNAILTEAQLPSVDLRTARLDGASFEKANLQRAQMEDVVVPKAMLFHANLRGALLTGSAMPLADMRGADLSNTGLAEINWEGANLQGANLKGATFHMGSSRSGMVGSPIACEGSKTGFYTDDYEDMHFKRPEEVRKANLCGADLRGANIDGLDFYLVDLRYARLDADQLRHVRKCGAILEDVLS